MNKSDMRDDNRLYYYYGGFLMIKRRKMRSLKRFLLCILTLTITISCTIFSPISVMAETALTEETELQAGYTYTIATAEQLSYLSTLVSKGMSSHNITFKLLNDIDLNPGIIFDSNGGSTGDAVSFSPIGTGTFPFKGIFDGNGYTIRGIYINSTDSADVGLFGSIDNATIKDVSISNSYISGNGTVGGICGTAKNTSVITRCTNGAYIVGKGNYTGGICGYLTNLKSTITYCDNNTAIVSTAETTGATSSVGVGGICGAVNTLMEDIPSVSHSYNTASITAAGDNVGGVIGYTNAPTSICYNAGTVSGKDYVGGVCGYVDSGSINNTYNLGDITGNMYVGGIAGSTMNYIYCAYSVGSLSCADADTGDEIAGYIQNSADAVYALNGTYKTELSVFAGSSLPSTFDISVWEKPTTSSTYSYPALIGIANPKLDCDENGKLQSVATNPSADTALPPSASHNVTASYQTAAASTVVYSVDIAWGSLHFDYTAGTLGTWDPTTHTYFGETSGSWSCEDGANRITITNHSNVGLTATFSYTPSAAYTGINGTFTNTTIDLATAVGTAYNNAPTGSTALNLQGDLSDETADNSTIGTITVIFAKK